MSLAVYSHPVHFPIIATESAICNARRDTVIHLEDTNPMSDIAALAKKFFDRIEQGDISVLREVYAPNVEIWHNTDEQIQSLEDNVQTLQGFAQRIPKREYTNRRLQVFPGGFVQQHRLIGTRKDGKRVELEACIICKVENGRITRLDEYFDSAAVAKFREP